MRNKGLFFIALVGISISTLEGCREGNNPSGQTPSLVTAPPPRYGALLSPSSDTVLHLGDSLCVRVSRESAVDSVTLRLSETPLCGDLPSEGMVVATDAFPTGVHWLQATFWQDSTPHVERLRLQILAGQAPVDYTYVVEKEYPHDEGAYTQGLLYRDGVLYESTGQRGESRLRRVELTTGRGLSERRLSDQYFGEGLEYLNGRFYQLTWTSHLGFIYDGESLDSVGTFHYNTQGWGLTTDGSVFYLSDGTEAIYVLDTATLQVRRTLQVYTESGALYRLNELEWVDGRIYANVYTTDKIAIINPKSGAVEGLIHCEGLLRPGERGQRAEVLNGIAYDRAEKKLYLTGKYWPYLYRVSLIPRGR